MKARTLNMKYKMILTLVLIIITIFFNIFYTKGNPTPKRKFIFHKETELLNEIPKFKSFSEYFEDLILFTIVSDIKNGFYIDVGAYDPNFVSVTKAFYLRGWNGINIEPQSNQIELFKKERPNDINLQLVIGKNEGNVTFYVDGQCSTVKEKYAKKLNKSINIKMDTLKNICRKYVPKGKEIDFCKIDVEGNERNVLLGYDFKNYRPKVFCVESTIPLSFIPNHQLWEEILINNSYTFVFQYKVNRFYVNNDYPELLEISKKIKIYLKNKLHF